MTSINILQLNARHTKRCHDFIQMYLKDKDIDIMIIQEPYLTNNKLAGYPYGSKLFQSCVNNPRAGVIICNPNIDGCLLNQFTDRDFVTVEITYKSNKCIIVSGYFDIEVDLKVLNVINSYTESRIILGIDTNCRSKLWFDRLTNERGAELEYFIVTNNLVFLNQLSSLTTFDGHRGKSNMILLYQILLQYEITELQIGKLKTKPTFRTIITYLTRLISIMSKTQFKHPTSGIT